MSTQTNDLVKFDEIKAAVTLFVAPTSQIVVNDSETDVTAASTLRAIKEWRKKIEDKRVEYTKPLLDRQREITAYAKEIDKPLEDAELQIKNKRRIFALAEEDRRRKEQERIAAERREMERKAAEERSRIEAEIRAKREAEERARRDEQERQRKELEARQREEAAAMKAFGVDPEAEKQAAEAKALAESQEAARIEAERLAQEERILTQARLDREAKEREAELRRKEKALEASRPKNTRKDWIFEVKDANAIPREFLVLDETAVHKAIAAGRRDIAGLRIFQELRIVGR